MVQIGLELLLEHPLYGNPYLLRLQFHNPRTLSNQMHGVQEYSPYFQQVQSINPNPFLLAFEMGQDFALQLLVAILVYLSKYRLYLLYQSFHL